MWLLFQRIISEDVRTFFHLQRPLMGWHGKPFGYIQVSKQNCCLEKNWKIPSFWCESIDNCRYCPPSNASQHLFSRLNCSPPLVSRIVLPILSHLMVARGEGGGLCRDYVTHHPKGFTFTKRCRPRVVIQCQAVNKHHAATQLDHTPPLGWGRESED